MKKPSVQDFSLLHQFVARAKEENALRTDSQGFYHVLLNLLFDLQDDEIDQSITDDDYAVGKGESPALDRGIDAIVIDEKIDPPTVHLLNCKYSSKLESTRSFFPGNEIDELQSLTLNLTVD